MKKNNPIAILKRYAKVYKTKEKYITYMQKMDLIPSTTQRMTELTLEAYWVYFNDLEQIEKEMRGGDISTFIHGYVSKKIHE
jgi:hypothetical protein|tara:strand:+ start:365 stop:610 length:246 start_codon:yes stop_codon:yes gene_type:complete